jgi:hypothetical protein
VKPAPFAWYPAGSADEALALLAEHGDAAKLLAGGQSLIPAMNSARGWRLGTSTARRSSPGRRRPDGGRAWGR